MSGIVGSSHNIRGSGIVAKLGTDGQVFTSAGAGVKQTYETASGGDNTPAFLAFLSSAQSAISDATWTKVAFNSELFDTDNTFDNSSNFRFTPGTEAKYMLFCQAGGAPNTAHSTVMGIRFYKNGAVYSERMIEFVNSEIKQDAAGWSLGHQTVAASDDDDYWEVFVYQDTGDVTWDLVYDSAEHQTYFGAYKIIT